MVGEDNRVPELDARYKKGQTLPSTEKFILSMGIVFGTDEK